METEIQAFAAELDSFLGMLQMHARNLLLPSRLIQIGLLLVCLALAWGLRRWVSPRMRDWMRTLNATPTWRLRLLLSLEKRLQLIFFVILSWAVTLAVRQTTPFPSRSYILALVATMATAMLVVGLATRVVRNPLMRRTVRWGLWSWVIIYYLGLQDDAEALLDSVAITAGDLRISALTVLKALIITAVLFTFARFVTTTLSARVRANPDMSPSMKVLLVKLMQIAFYGAAFFIGLKAVGFDLTGLAVLSGAIGLGLGFGLQKVVSNLVSGFIILLDKSIKPGDVISLGDTFGWIESLGARYVSVVTRDGREYLIPNEDLITSQVVNWTHSDEYVRLDIHFGTSYHDDPHKVRAVAVEAAQKVDRVLRSKTPVCHITGFGDSSVDYVLRFWIGDPTNGLTNVRGNVYLALWDAFRENGISIPFPQREVRLLPGSEVGHRALD